MKKEGFILHANFTNKNIEVAPRNNILFKNYKNVEKNLLRAFEVVVVTK